MQHQEVERTNSLISAENIVSSKDQIPSWCISHDLNQLNGLNRTRNNDTQLELASVIMYTSARSTREVNTSEESCFSFCVRLRDASASARVSRVAGLAGCSISDVQLVLCGSLDSAASVMTMP